MDTSSMIYIYNKEEQLICKLHLQFDGYPNGIGIKIATFLTLHKNTDMELLSAKLVSCFLKTQPEDAMLIAHEDSRYYCQSCEYHIYTNRVKIIDSSSEDYHLNWHTDEFQLFCQNFMPHTDEESDEDY